MNRKVVVVSVIAIVAGIALLGAWAISSPDALSYFVTASDLKADPANSSRRIRLGGRVSELSKSGGVVSFTVTDEVENVDVIYKGEVPDTLKTGTDVVAEGRIGPDGTLVADRVLAKCASKFVPVEEERARARSSAKV